MSNILCFVNIEYIHVGQPVAAGHSKKWEYNYMHVLSVPMCTSLQCMLIRLLEDKFFLSHILPLLFVHNMVYRFTYFVRLLKFYVHTLLQHAFDSNHSWSNVFYLLQERCVIVLSGTNNEGLWNSTGCNEKHAYICETNSGIHILYTCQGTISHCLKCLQLHF